MWMTADPAVAIAARMFARVSAGHCRARIAREQNAVVPLRWRELGEGGAEDYGELHHAH